MRANNDGLQMQISWATALEKLWTREPTPSLVDGVPQTPSEWRRVAKGNPLRTLKRLHGQIPQHLLRYAVAWTYETLDYPGLVLPQQEWIKLWRRAGYSTNYRGRNYPDRPPAKAMRLWRGADPGHERGMSWSPVRRVADAHRYLVPDKELGGRYWRGPNSPDAIHPTARIYVTIAPPEAFLGSYFADINGQKTHFEVVLDPTDLKIKESR